MRNPLMTYELAIIRNHFPNGGAKACSKQIDRTENAIRLIAWKHGIRRNQDALKEIRASNVQGWIWK